MCFNQDKNYVNGDICVQEIKFISSTMLIPKIKSYDCSELMIGFFSKMSIHFLVIEWHNKFTRVWNISMCLLQLKI